MTTEPRRKALGRGLAALIPVPTSPSKREFFECAIEDVYPSEDNPRRSFDEARLGELAESIRAQGIVQPLVVRARAEGGFTVVAGERRWRAAQRAGLKTVPVVVKDVSPARAYELTLVENLQREDLNPIEEAEAYHRLQTDFGYTQEQVADRVGKERATVANAVRLLKLPGGVRSRVASGELSMGHARALLGLEQALAIEQAAARVLERQLSVRQTEALVRALRAGRVAAARRAPARSASARDLEARLEKALGTKVRLVERGAGQGHLEISYHSLDHLDGLLERLLRR